MTSLSIREIDSRPDSPNKELPARNINHASLGMLGVRHIKTRPRSKPQMCLRSRQPGRYNCTCCDLFPTRLVRNDGYLGPLGMRLSKGREAGRDSPCSSREVELPCSQLNIPQIVSPYISLSALVSPKVELSLIHI